MELYVVGYGGRCVIANQRLETWDGENFGDLQHAQLFRRRSLAHKELERIEASLRQSTVKTYVNRVGPEEFPRFVIVNEDEDVFDGQGFGHIRSAIVYAHRALAEQDAARIEAERSDFFHGD